jgi:hypothetical protein
MVLVHAAMEFKQPPGSSSPVLVLDGQDTYPSPNPVANTEYGLYVVSWEYLVYADLYAAQPVYPGVMFYLSPGTHTIQWALRLNPGGGYAQNLRLAALAL